MTCKNFELLNGRSDGLHLLLRMDSKAILFHNAAATTVQLQSAFCLVNCLGKLPIRIRRRSCGWRKEVELVFEGALLHLDCFLMNRATSSALEAYFEDRGQ